MSHRGRRCIWLCLPCPTPHTGPYRIERSTLLLRLTIRRRRRGADARTNAGADARTNAGTDASSDGVTETDGGADDGADGSADRESGRWNQIRMRNFIGVMGGYAVFFWS